jgi:YidC/Oxa1 family membrane protein insertase
MFKDAFDKNTILGMILIFTMVGGYFYLSKKRFEDQAKQQKIQEELKKSSAASTTVATVDSSAKSTSKLSTIAAADTAKPIKGENIILSNELISISVNTTGAKINDAILAKHTSHKNQSVELLNNEFTKFDYIMPIAGANVSTRNLGFSVVSKSADKLELVAANGLKVTYSLTPNSYLLKQVWTSPAIAKGAKAELKLETQMNCQEANLARERQFSSINYKRNEDEILTSLDKNKNETIEEPMAMNWISLSQQFFNVSIIPQNGFASGFLESKFTEGDTSYVKNYTVKSTIAPQDNQIAIDYYVGPSDYKILKKMDKSLELVVPLSQDFVLFRWMKIFNIYLIIPIFDFLSRFFSNYGIIILLMTIFIKIITAPLSYKTYKSGVAMKILKPQLDKLKVKFGDDQQKLSQEQMKLYGEFGVSPFGGCLPMLLQMPILFAMFNFFPSSIELRHQPFLWAHDLSTYDSILKLPFSFYDHVSLFALLTALTQVGMTMYSQRLQPSSPQADQMKMMTYFMPVIFLFMFNSFPAALTFYYFLQNVLSMIQQWFFTTFIIKEDAVRAEMELAKKTPKKQSGFQKKMADMMAQAEEQKKLQQNNNKK